MTPTAEGRGFVPVPRRGDCPTWPSASRYGPRLGPAGALWTCLNEALGASLVFGSQRRHITTSRVGRVNGVIADGLRSSAGERLGCDDWPL